jgi:hypothetical protein
MESYIRSVAVSLGKAAIRRTDDVLEVEYPLWAFRAYCHVVLFCGSFDLRHILSPVSSLILWTTIKLSKPFSKLLQSSAFGAAILR